MRVKITIFLIAFISFSCNQSKKEDRNQSTNSQVELTHENDSIYYNINNPTKDRVLLFEKKFFVWIYESALDDDKLMYVTYGKYRLQKDTIFFTPPDSADVVNSLFCYCTTDNDMKKQFLFKNENNNSTDLNNVYIRIFKKETRIKKIMQEFGNFYSVRQSNAFELILDSKKYILLKE